MRKSQHFWLQIENEGCFTRIFVKLSFFSTHIQNMAMGAMEAMGAIGAMHTCKKRVMLWRRLFWPKKNCGKSA